MPTPSNFKHSGDFDPDGPKPFQATVRRSFITRMCRETHFQEWLQEMPPNTELMDADAVPYYQLATDGQYCVVYMNQSPADGPPVYRMVSARDAGAEVPMDPVENLREQLEIAREVQAAEDAGETTGSLDGIDVKLSRLSELVLALHEWRENGGYDPELHKEGA